uniref:Diaminopimelate decarboxylase n=1 Tax=Angomonas desouzai TaxID=59800 RepID=U5KN60_9TRYP|nr:diaminopimelate decarboxylase [Angomonas desouzai]
MCFEIIKVIDIGGGFPVDFSSDNEGIYNNNNNNNEKEGLNMKQYVSLLKEQVPQLFLWKPFQENNNNNNDDKYIKQRTIITEFGRTIAAKSGVFISRIEYIKYIDLPNNDNENENNDDDENNNNENDEIIKNKRQIILQHVGADLAVRTVWQPSHWPLRVKLYNGENGEEKQK